MYCFRFKGIESLGEVCLIRIGSLGGECCFLRGVESLCVLKAILGGEIACRGIIVGG